VVKREKNQGEMDNTHHLALKHDMQCAHPARGRLRLKLGGERVDVRCRGEGLGDGLCSTVG
jgi:hypothetical protein